MHYIEKGGVVEYFRNEYKLLDMTIRGLSKRKASFNQLSLWELLINTKEVKSLLSLTRSDSSFLGLGWMTLPRWPVKLHWHMRLTRMQSRAPSAEFKRAAAKCRQQQHPQPSNAHPSPPHHHPFSAVAPAAGHQAAQQPAEQQIMRQHRLWWTWLVWYFTLSKYESSQKSL